MLPYLETSLRKERNLDTSSWETVTCVERWDRTQGLRLLGRPGNESRDPENWQSTISNESGVVEVALVFYIDYCLFERLPCNGFCLVVKQVVDKENWLDINHINWLEPHSCDEILWFTKKINGLILIIFSAHNVTAVMRFLWLGCRGASVL
jgi:hypothetical protein